MDTPSSRGQDTRQAILDAAYDLFVAQGFHATSMRQIAEGSGTALGGIYNHFESKEQIFETLVLERHPIRRLLEILSQAPGDTVEDFFRSAARGMQAELRSQPGFINLALVEITEFKTQHVPLLIRTFLPQSLALLERFRGEHSQMRDLPAQLIMASFLSAMLAGFASAYFLGSPNPPDLETQLDIFFHGILKAEQP
jgi:AcrR family transcriptional regulator